MRRTVTTLLLWSLSMAGAAIVPAPVGAQSTPGASPGDVPPGFTDGVPVGGTELPGADVPVVDGTVVSSGGARETSPIPTKYFGQGPWDAINAATSVTPRCAGLSAPMLTALVVSPIFKESSGATSPSTAPSPMTLSRYDEWNGTLSTATNQSANYGLYAFRDPFTAYTRAYWHPGIGIWQYDSAGVGAPFTAIERMNVGTVGADVARGMADRYCNPPASVVGHTAPFTAQERRDAAWWPWWAGSTTRSCPLCQTEYDRMTASSPYFANVSLVSGISATGGAVKRSCTLPGLAGTIECWYVNPSVGVIQGATAWATVAPDGGGSPTVKPAPLSKPFYVLKRNGREERHWLKSDSGYSIDISGSRALGQNERPRAGQPASGISWLSSSGLCDVTAGRGSCGPRVEPPVSNPVPAPAVVPVTSTATSVSGTYRSVALDADGDGQGDVLWHVAGSAPDYLWLGKGSGTFRSVPVSISGRFDVVVPLDVDGDRSDDLLFYASDTGESWLWRSRGDGSFTSTRVYPGAARRPLVLNNDGQGGDEIFWFGPGRVGDSVWSWNGSAFSARTESVDGNYAPLVGDFDGNGADDIFWYQGGPATDWLWLSTSTGAHRSVAKSVSGTYEPALGDFDGNGAEDILWYAPGPAGESVWFGAGGGTFASQSLSVTDTYEPVSADLDGDGRDEVLWHEGLGRDLWTRWSSSRARVSVSLRLSGAHQPLVGAFSAGEGDGLLWYAKGTKPDAVWWR